MSTAFVRYEVSVFAEVDTDLGEVVSVHVDDENVGTPQGVLGPSMMPLMVPGVMGDDWRVNAHGYTEGDETALWDAAVKVAEDASWPGWEFGW